MELEFEWDPEKEESNLRKHGVSFHEGATVFGDPLSWTFPDPDHVGARILRGAAMVAPCGLRLMRK